MTIKDVSTLAGVSVQAVYKRLKTQGISLDDVRDRETGQLTKDGETVVKSIFNLDAKPDSTVQSELNELKIEVERLTTALDLIREERDYLREQLKATQVLQMEALKKIPAALPDGNVAQKKRGIFSWFMNAKNEKK